MTSRSLVIEADGGSRGNPGIGGYGALVRDRASGRLLAERAAPLGKVSNNVAEYSGLIAGLTAVLELGLEADADIEVNMDSQLVIEQMAGRWKIKHEDMRRLATQAQGIVRQLREAGGQVRWTWVPRAKNKAADALSNDAMDGLTIHRDHLEPVTDSGYRGDMGAVATEHAEQADDPVAPATREQIAEQVELDLEISVPEDAPDLTSGTRVLLVRHAVTDNTVAGRLDGRGGQDPALNAEGIAQAQAAAERLHALLESTPGKVTVVASALRRTQQTAAPLAAMLGTEVLVDDSWDEQCFGDWDGRSVGELSDEDAAMLVRMRTSKDVSLPGGESYRALARRVATGVVRAREHGGTVVVVTSRRPILAVLDALLDLGPERSWQMAVSPGSVTEITWWSDGVAAIGYVNDVRRP